MLDIPEERRPAVWKLYDDRRASHEALLEAHVNGAFARMARHAVTALISG